MLLQLLRSFKSSWASVTSSSKLWKPPTPKSHQTWRQLLSKGGFWRTRDRQVDGKCSPFCPAVTHREGSRKQQASLLQGCKPNKQAEHCGFVYPAQDGAQGFLWSLFWGFCWQVGPAPARQGLGGAMSVPRDRLGPFPNLSPEQKHDVLRGRVSRGELGARRACHRGSCTRAIPHTS